MRVFPAAPHSRFAAACYHRGCRSRSTALRCTVQLQSERKPGPVVQSDARKTVLEGSAAAPLFEDARAPTLEQVPAGHAFCLDG